MRKRRPAKAQPALSARLEPICVTIYCGGKPKPKQSTNFTTAGGKRAFPKKDALLAEKELRDLARAEMQRLRIPRPYLGLVRIEACWYLDHASMEEADWAAQGGEIQPCFPPDSGNLLKLAEDAFKGVDGLFLDDSQCGVHLLVKRHHWWHGALYNIYLSDPPHDGQYAKRLQALAKAQEKAARKKQRATGPSKEIAHAAVAQVTAELPVAALKKLKKSRLL
jgi:hypothetical protein